MVKPTRRLRLLFLGLAVCACVAVTAVFVLLPRHWQGREDYHRLTGLLHDYSIVSRVLDEWVAATGEPPPSNLIDLVEGVPSKPNLRWIAKQVDPWGTPLIYRSSRLAGSEIYEVTLRSWGPDRTDDNGGGDDMQRTYLVVVPSKNSPSGAAGP